MQFRLVTLIILVISISISVVGCAKKAEITEKRISFKRPERWKFLEPSDKEYQDKLNAIAAIDQFWRQFEKDESKLSPLKNPQYGEFWITWSKNYLRKLDEHLNYEVGFEKEDSNKCYLVITCDNYQGVDPFVQTVIERAPKLDNWNLYRHFFRYSHKRIEDAVCHNTDQKLPAFNFQFKTMPGSLIGVIITAPTFHGDNIKEDKIVAWELLELALGEEDLWSWIGAVETRMEPSKLTTYASSRRLQKQFSELKRLLINRIPAKFYYEMDLDEKTLSHLRTSLTSRPFASQRFSRKGETFCALATKDKNPFDTDAKRDALREDLQRLLLDAKLGCIIDASLETEKGFCIDLCVTDVEKTIAILRKYCSAHKMPPNTYLFFFDETLTYEWVALLPGANPYKENK